MHLTAHKMNRLWGHCESESRRDNQQKVVTGRDSAEIKSGSFDVGRQRPRKKEYDLRNLHPTGEEIK